jgi:hypothetical protein
MHFIYAKNTYLTTIHAKKMHAKILHDPYSTKSLCKNYKHNTKFIALNTWYSRCKKFAFNKNHPE